MAAPLTPEIYRAVLDSLPIGVYLVDRQRQIVSWNHEAAKLTGYLGQEVIGRGCWDGLLMHCDVNNTVLCGVACPLLHTMRDGQPRQADIFLRHKDGQRIPVRVRAAPLRDGDGSIIGAVESFEERVVSPFGAPWHDGDLSAEDGTPMPDRPAMLKRLQTAIEDLPDGPLCFGVLSFAVDGLDLLRRTYGRHAVNAILHVTARTLSRNLGPGNLLGRGAQEGFLAIIRGCQAPELVKSAELLKKLVGLAGVPWWGDRLSVTLSIGGAIARAGDTPESLAGRAEEALQASLAEPGGRVIVA